MRHEERGEGWRGEGWVGTEASPAPRHLQVVLMMESKVKSGESLKTRRCHRNLKAPPHRNRKSSQTTPLYNHTHKTNELPVLTKHLKSLS